MGRRAIGDAPMTATEYQRRWRKRRRLGIVGRAESRRPVAETAPASDQTLVDELRHDLDRARRELTLLTAPATAVEPGNPARCFICLRRRDEVPVMLTAERRRFQLFLCDGCIEEFHRLASEKLDKLAPSPE